MTLAQIQAQGTQTHGQVAKASDTGDYYIIPAGGDGGDALRVMVCDSDEALRIKDLKYLKWMAQDGVTVSASVYYDEDHDSWGGEWIFGFDWRAAFIGDGLIQWGNNASVRDAMHHRLVSGAATSGDTLRASKAILFQTRTWTGDASLANHIGIQAVPLDDSGTNTVFRMWDQAVVTGEGGYSSPSATTGDVTGNLRLESGPEGFWHTGSTGGSELSADPDDPAEGQHVTWQSDGTGSGDDGDIMMKITAGGVTKTTTLVSLDPSGNLHVAGNLELGHESDTTLSRSSAGVLAVEGVNAQLVSGATALETVAIACSDETTDLTTGTAKATFRMPFAMTLTEVRASVTTAPTGSTAVFDINEGGTTILSTKLSIDASEKTSVTAATPAVISDSALADDAEITIDIDQIGSGTAGAGLKVTLIGYRT